MRDENCNLSAAKSRIPDIIENYFNEAEGSRDLGRLHSVILDLVWELLEDEGLGESGSEIAIHMSTLCYVHYYASLYGIADSVKEISKACSDAEEKKGVYPFLQDILQPEAMDANPKAVRLLVRFAGYEGMNFGKSIDKILLKAVKGHSEIRDLVIDEVQKWMNDYSKIARLAEVIDPEWVFRCCAKSLRLFKKCSYPYAIISASRLKLSDDSLSLLLNTFQTFWVSADWERSYENRRAYYSVVQKGYRRKVIDVETALYYMYYLFKNHFVEDLGGDIKAAEVIREIAQERYAEVLYNGALILLGGEENMAEADSVKIENRLDGFLKNLDSCSARLLLMALIRNTEFHDLIWYAVDSLTRFPANEEMRLYFEEVFNTRSDGKLFSLGQFFMKIRSDRSFRNLQKKYGSLPNLVIARLKRESDPAHIFTLVDIIAEWGSKEDVEFALPYLDKILEESETLSVTIIFVALNCCLAMESSGRKKKKPAANVVLKMLEREHIARKGGFLESIYYWISNGGFKRNDGSNIIFPAIEFVSLVKPASSISFFLSLLAGENEPDKLDYPMKSACIEHLRVMAIGGSVDALEMFGVIPEVQHVLWSSPLANLVHIAKESEIGEIRERAIVFSSQRLAEILSDGSYSEIESAMEAISLICGEPSIQECLLASLEQGLCYSINEDMRCLISRVSDFIIPCNRPRAILILKASIHLIAWKLREKDVQIRSVHDSCDLEKLLFEIMEALRKLENL